MWFIFYTYFFILHIKQLCLDAWTDAFHLYIHTHIQQETKLRWTFLFICTTSDYSYTEIIITVKYFVRANSILLST